MERQPRDVSALLERLRRPPRVKFLFFWGHGAPGRGYLSQWWPSPFELSGRTFATAEHYMMWRKALLFDDQAAAEAIGRASHPRQAKELGRTVRDFDQRQWEAQRYEIVVAGNVAKFGQHPYLRRFLQGTGDRVLVEASPLDAVWGIGLAAGDPRAEDPRQWPGLNLLGFALGEARAILTHGGGPK